MLSGDISKPEILILLGARQVGKTTLMKELEKVATQLGRKIHSYNLEFPQDLHFFARTDIELFREFSKEENIVLFIDEFHYLKNASKLFKGLYDLKKNIKIIVSGSSSLEIHKHLQESLAGRRKIVKVFPLAYSEFSQINQNLDDFLIYGGMPGLLHSDTKNDKMDYLTQMIQTYILKDVKGLIKEENIRAFNHLLFYLAEHQGQILPATNIANEIGVTSKTVDSYIEILEQTFVVHSLSSYSSKLSNELKKSKKYYFYDLGIRNALMKDFKSYTERTDGGAILESFAMLELIKRQRANIELRFWRTKSGNEVDFLWIENRIPTPIEIKSNMKNDRHPSGLLKFMANYPEAKKGYVFCLDRVEDVETDNGTIHYRHLKDISSYF